MIHVVGPNYRAGERDRSLLVSCYANALAVADEIGARSVYGKGSTFRVVFPLPVEVPEIVPTHTPQTEPAGH